VSEGITVGLYGIQLRNPVENWSFIILSRREGEGLILSGVRDICKHVNRTERNPRQMCDIL
jgi:hypothetical protein